MSGDGIEVMVRYWANLIVPPYLISTFRERPCGCVSEVREDWYDGCWVIECCDCRATWLFEDEYDFDVQMAKIP